MDTVGSLTVLSSELTVLSNQLTNLCYYLSVKAAAGVRTNDKFRWKSVRKVIFEEY